MEPQSGLRQSVGERVGKWGPHAALLFVQVAFSSQAVEAKIAMLPRAIGGEGIAPETLTMARMLGAAIVFQVITRVSGALVRTTLRDKLVLLPLSLAGIVLNQSLFLLGLRVTTPMTVSLIGNSVPVLTAALAVLFRFERPSWKTGLGLLCALSGVLWLTGVHSIDRGAVVVGINCLSFSTYLVFSRNVIRRLGAITVVTWAFTWSILLFAPFGARGLVTEMSDWTPRGVRFVAYIVLVPTILAYLANAWALGRSSASLVTAYIYLQPPITALLAWIQLGQAVSPRMLVSGVLILAGVGIVATRQPSSTRESRASASSS